MKPTAIFLFLQLIGFSFVFAQAETIPAPFIYTPERIEQARVNAAKYDWAATLLQDKLLLADEAAAQPAEHLRAWFTTTTPNDQTSCPSCGEYWLNYVWA